MNCTACLRGTAVCLRPSQAQPQAARATRQAPLTRSRRPGAVRRSGPVSRPPTNASAAGASVAGDSARTPDAFLQLERIIAQGGAGGPGGSRGPGRWEMVDGAWVLRPPEGTPSVVVIHFIGGAFVGASPELTYNLFLGKLAARGALIVATPFRTSFDHLRVADECQFLYDRAARKLKLDDAVTALPRFGLGHSMGALAHVLIAARYPSDTRGNALLSFNNKPATEAIPLFSPLIAPLMQGLDPLLRQLQSSPARASLDALLSRLKALSPPGLAQLLPLIEQLEPLYADVAAGRSDFTPPKAEVARMVRSFYGVRRNLLLKFKDDPIDETPALAALLQESAAAGLGLELTVHVLTGDHVRPLQQPLPDDVVAAAKGGGEFLGRLAALAGPAGSAGTPLGELAKGVSGLAAGVTTARAAAVDADLDVLVDDVATWMGLPAAAGERELPKGPIYLPR